MPRLVEVSGARACEYFLEFFNVGLPNPHTRRAYARAIDEFMSWCDQVGLSSLAAVRPLHVAGWVDMRESAISPASVKQQLAAVRRLFDWFVLADVLPTNPAASVRGPRQVSHSIKTPILEPEEVRRLQTSIEETTPLGLRDRALIALMIYSFARIGVALAMKVEDVFALNGKMWVRLREEDSGEYALPCHHNLEKALTEYLKKTGIAADPKGPLFRTIGRKTRKLTRTALPQANAHAMIRRRAQAAGIQSKIGNHSFRAIGITAYLKNGGTLENAAAIAHHASVRTTQRYDRDRDRTALVEIERIVF
jgi:site-specific recombinase XerD